MPAAPPSGSATVPIRFKDYRIIAVFRVFIYTMKVQDFFLLNTSD